MCFRYLIGTIIYLVGNFVTYVHLMNFPFKLFTAWYYKRLTSCQTYTKHQHQKNFVCELAERASLDFSPFSHSKTDIAFFIFLGAYLLGNFLLVALIALFIGLHVPTKLQKCIIEVAISPFA